MSGLLYHRPTIYYQMFSLNISKGVSFINIYVYVLSINIYVFTIWAFHMEISSFREACILCPVNLTTGLINHITDTNQSCYRHMNLYRWSNVGQQVMSNCVIV